MNASKVRKFSMVGCLVLLTSLFLGTVVYAASIRHGPINHSTASYYRIGDERVKFKAFIVSTTKQSELHKLAANTKNQKDTHIWDDKWYYWTLPDDRNKYLLLTWYNPDAGEYAWLVIRNTPSKWYYKTNGNSNWRTISNEQQIKQTWWSNGHRIDIDVLNPGNGDGGWTPNDIWYSFGY